MTSQSVYIVFSKLSGLIMGVYKTYIDAKRAFDSDLYDIREYPLEGE